LSEIINIGIYDLYDGSGKLIPRRIWKESQWQAFHQNAKVKHLLICKLSEKDVIMMGLLQRDR